MARHVYLAIILNFIVHFLLLLGTNRLSCFPAGVGRCALGAAIGAAYSGACLLSKLRFLAAIQCRLLCLGLMGWTAFGAGAAGWKRCGAFGLLNLALEGLVREMDRGSFWTLPLSAAAVWVLCRMAFGGGNREYLRMGLRWGDRQMDVTALRDTGNTLRDPVTGEPVLIVSGAVGSYLTGLTQAQLQNPMETMVRHPIPGLRLIPFRAVGKSAGMLLALPMEGSGLGRKEGKVLVAFDPWGLDREQGYQALVGSVS